MRPLFVAIISSPNNFFDEIKNKFEIKYFDFSNYTTFMDFYKEKEEKDFDLIIIDDDSFDDNLENPDLKNLIISDNIILYSAKETYKNQSVFYNNGGWMAAIGQLSEQRIIFFLNQMLQFENHLIPTIRKKNLFVGDIVNFSLKELLMSAFMEKKSFQIFVISEKNNGKIFIKDGFLKEALWGHSKGIEAILRMLFLQNGKIRVVPLRRQFEKHLNYPTILSIIHEFEFEKNMIANWLKKEEELTINNSKIIWNENKSYIFKNHNEKLLSKKLIKGLGIEGIISTLDLLPIKTLEILINYEENDNIQIIPIEDVTDEQAGYIQIENKEKWIKEKFILEETIKNARLLILGHHSSGKSNFISLLEGKGSQKKSVRNLESIKIEINSEFNLNVLSLSLEQDVMPALKAMGSKIDAYIFFIDATKSEKFEYINYLLNMFINTHNIPALVVLTNCLHLDNSALELIKSKFNVPASTKFISTNIEKIKDPWYLINELELIELEENLPNQKHGGTNND